MKNYKKNNFLFNKKPLEQGIALVFSIVLSTIFLTIAVGVLGITMNELNFSISSKDSNNAFYAADTGVDCALYNDRSDVNFFIDGPMDTNIFCPGVVANLTSGANSFPDFDFEITELGSNLNSCVKVHVLKKLDTDGVTIIGTEITSKGYNITGNLGCGGSSGSSIVERVLEVNY